MADKNKDTVEDVVEEAVQDVNANAGDTATKNEDTNSNSEEATEKVAEDEGSKQADNSDKPDKKDKIIEELTDKYKRTFAEFDNFRKRSEKEKAAMYEIGARDIIEKVLPVVDNFERGLATVSEEDKGTPFVDGMDKIYKQFLKVLDDAGVKPIEAVGEEFNPDYHNAVMHIEDDSYGENIIVEELQKGYTYRESVVRHSMVKVAN